MFRKIVFSLVFASMLLSACGPQTQAQEPIATPVPMAPTKEATVLPPPVISGQMPPMYADDMNSCFSGKRVEDPVSHLFFCPVWKPWDDLAKFYEVQGETYTIVLHEREGEVPYLIVIQPDGIQLPYSLFEGQDWAIGLWNSDITLLNGPIFFILRDGMLYYDDTLKDVVRRYVVPQGPTG